MRPTLLCLLYSSFLISIYLSLRFFLPLLPLHFSSLSLPISPVSCTFSYTPPHYVASTFSLPPSVPSVPSPFSLSLFLPTSFPFPTVFPFYTPSLLISISLLPPSSAFLSFYLMFLVFHLTPLV